MTTLENTETWGMCMKYDVEPTATIIDDMAKTLKHYARELESTAKRMRDTGDLTYAAEATMSIANITQNLRLDLLVARPLRETMKHGE